jgi:tetratricopeptide (TPR) repeat protein
LDAQGDTRAALVELQAGAALLSARRHAGTSVAEIAVHALLAHAAVLRAAGRYREARRRARQALRRAEHELAKGHDLVASAHNELGMIAKFAGWFDEAATHYEAALPLVRRRYGVRSREMARLWHNVGGLDHARGDFARGERAARRSVAIARQLLRSTDPERVAHEVAHAALLDGLGRQRESIAIYRRALTTYRRTLGADHYEVAATLHNLAAAEHDLGRLSAALAHTQESLRLHVRLLGPNHPDVGLAYFNLGVLELDLERPTAGRSLARACVVLGRSLGPHHPHTRACRAALRELKRR